ncbi:hypothetical protein BU15DRAFT_81665 [Melanogaster broomeanus]|nr:hypothetical protein BU15DRAFT_81665 [Melanogaster broomeanus]
MTSCLNPSEDVMQPWGVDPPPWLADEDVHEGTKYLLERDRCLEEEDKAAHERCHLQEWLKAEWDAVVLLVHSHWLEVNDHDMVHQLDLKKDELSDVEEEGFREQLVDEEDDWESDEENREDDELLDALEDLGLLDEY